MSDQALADVQSACNAFGVLAAGDFADPSRYHDVVASVHSLCGRIVAAERAGAAADAIREAVADARAIHGQSPFIRRLQTWPRGYPGDFETIEYLIGQRVQAVTQTVEYWLEYLALSSPVAQQHRNKVLAQAREITAAVLSGRPSPKVLVLAAGSSPDLLLAQPALTGRDFAVVLNDGDDGAISFSTGRLNGIRDRVRTVPGNVLSSASKLAPHGPFDLVLAGGLFDYLPDKHAVYLLRTVWERLLAPGGRLFLTNIGRGNPYRVWIEYLADWRLIERSDAELRQLVATACGPGAACSVALEGTGLTWLVSVDRPYPPVCHAPPPTGRPGLLR